MRNLKGKFDLHVQKIDGPVVADISFHFNINIIVLIASYCALYIATTLLHSLLGFLISTTVLIVSFCVLYIATTLLRSFLGFLIQIAVFTVLYCVWCTAKTLLRSLFRNELFAGWCSAQRAVHDHSG